MIVKEREPHIHGPEYGKELLLRRGVEDIEEFIHPTIRNLESPSLLKNMGMAAAIYQRIVMDSSKRILIIVDCDVDGYTSATIVYQYSKLMNPDCQIDCWLHDGKKHGLEEHIDRLMNDNIKYDLLILPDSSSNDAHYHDMLDEIHLPCLVLDHHLTDVKLSDNAVVVNNQLSPNYMNKELTGAGVVYQFCRYIDEKNHTDYANNFIDLAALGIIGDMGSMMELENRYIVYTGIRNIQNGLFRYLLEKQYYSITGRNETPNWTVLNEKINPFSVAFYIVPMINALIRVGTMEEKEMMFTAFIDSDRIVSSNKRGAKGTPVAIKEEAARVATNAKNHQNKMVDDTMFAIEAKIFKYDLLENKILFIRLDEEKLPPEINGLLAMKLAAKYKKPTIVARLNDQGYDRGSARGINESELKDFRRFLLDTGLFEYAQGHANAFGVSIPDRSLDAFHAYANDKLKDVDFGENVYDVDFCYHTGQYELAAAIADICNYAGIWGTGNPEPLFYISGVPTNTARIMGSNNDTIKFSCGGIDFIKFKAKDLIEEVANNPKATTIDIVGKANMNEWGGRRTPQIMIDDYQISD